MIVAQLEIDPMGNTDIHVHVKGCFWATFHVNSSIVHCQRKKMVDAKTQSCTT